MANSGKCLAIASAIDGHRPDKHRLDISRQAFSAFATSLREMAGDTRQRPPGCLTKTCAAGLTRAYGLRSRMPCLTWG